MPSPVPRPVRVAWGHRLPSVRLGSSGTLRWVLVAHLLEPSARLPGPGHPLLVGSRLAVSRAPLRTPVRPAQAYVFTPPGRASAHPAWSRCPFAVTLCLRGHAVPSRRCWVLLGKHFRRLFMTVLTEKTVCCPLPVSSAGSGSPGKGAQARGRSGRLLFFPGSLEECAGVCCFCLNCSGPVWAGSFLGGKVLRSYLRGRFYLF